MAFTPEMLAMRKRLRDEFPLYAKAALKVRSKDAEIVPFVLNEAQRRLCALIDRQVAETGQVRIVILKGRQMGLSTAVGGRLFSRVSQREAKKAMVVTHHSDSTRALFEMTKRFYDECPDFLRPETRYNNKRELTFHGLNSSYVVATAGGDSIGRGEMLTHLHLSEVGFWPKSNGSDIFNGLVQAVPNTPDTEIYVESTAQGMSGLFYDLWTRACKGRGHKDWNGYDPIFLPWPISDEYREQVPVDFERTHEEARLAQEHGLDNEQLMFRRIKIGTVGHDKFRQEFPLTADEAFLTSGRPVFHPESLLELRKEHLREPLDRLTMLEGGQWESHPTWGELHVYHEHDPAETYTLGADVGLGVKRDWSVCQVLDSKRRQVAVWRGQAPPYRFAEILCSLGRKYNEGLIVPESNGPGMGLCDRLYRDLEYWNIWKDMVVDKTTEDHTERLGYQSNVKSKPLIIDGLRSVLHPGGIQIHDEATFQELQTYIVTLAGKMEAEPGTHDDTVIALALANHALVEAFDPITNDPSWFVTYD
jgi:hypothetical protein